MKSVLVLLVAAALVQISIQDSCHLREIDLCMATVVLAVQDSPVPTSEAQADEQCKVIREAYECITNYTNKCTSKLQRELMALATEGAHSALNEYCTAGSPLRKEILDRSECLTKSWDEQRSCMEDTQAGLESISKQPVDKRLDTLCCTYKRYRKCGGDIIDKNCGEGAAVWMEKLSSLVVSNLPNLICNSCEDDTAKCNGLLPAPGTKPQGSNSDSAIGQLIGVYLNN